MSLTRRKVMGVLVVASITALAGCAAAGPMTVKDTRLAHDGDKIGVYVELMDTNQNKAGSVTVHAELLDAQEEVIAEKNQEFDTGGRDSAIVVVWFGGISDGDREKVEGARASVGSK